MNYTKNQLIIVLDSSTSIKNSKGIGSSICFWVAYVYNPDEGGHPISAKLPPNVRYKSDSHGNIGY